MPFMDTTERVDFAFVNPKDPDGRLGLTPATWNLKKDAHGNIEYDAEGRAIVLEEDDPSYSKWSFAAHRTQADDDIITRKVARTNIEYDSRAARRQGRNYSPKFSQETMMSGLMALLTTMSRGWKGPEFMVPLRAKDGERPHPLAGKPAPCTAQWIAQRDPIELHAVEMFLQDLYEPEGEEEAARFPESSPSLDRSSGTQFDEAGSGGEDRFPDGSLSVSA